MKLFIFFISFVVVTTAFGLPLRRESRDLKLVSQQLIEKQTVTAPDAASTVYIASATAGNTDSTASVLTVFAAQPDVPRIINITPIGTTTALETCTIVVAGTNFFNTAITENFAFAADASTATTGTKAFKTVTSVTFPANCESGLYDTTFNIGVTDAVGLKRCMDYSGHGMWANFGGVYESTRPTFTADADEVEKNTVDINTALDAATNVEVFFLQNFRCFP